MLIAQLSDAHIRLGPLGGEAASHFHRALGRVLALDPWPDCVVVTGDLVETGSEAEYEAFREVVGNFPIPLHLAAGNHDDAGTMVKSFGGTTLLGHTDSPYYVVQYSDAAIIVLDSSVPGSVSGSLGTEQLLWLDETLRAVQTPAFVCLHHPPVPVGIPFLDNMRLEDGPALAQVISRYPHVPRVLAGHIHRAITAGFAGTILTIAPSTFRQASLGMGSDRPTGYVHEPPGLLLHSLTENGCVTHVVPTLDGSAPVGHF
jgi:Icc protein